MGWRSDTHLYLCEPLDYQAERLREQGDPHPGVSSLDEARAERDLDHEPGAALPAPQLLQPAGIRRLPGTPGNADAGVGGPCPRRPPGGEAA
jgi:hypothetical protein